MPALLQNLPLNRRASVAAALIAWSSAIKWACPRKSSSTPRRIRVHGNSWCFCRNKALSLCLRYLINFALSSVRCGGRLKRQRFNPRSPWCLIDAPDAKRTAYLWELGHGAAR